MIRNTEIGLTVSSIHPSHSDKTIKNITRKLQQLEMTNQKPTDRYKIIKSYETWRGISVIQLKHIADYGIQYLWTY